MQHKCIAGIFSRLLRMDSAFYTFVLLRSIQIYKTDETGKIPEHNPCTAERRSVERKKRQLHNPAFRKTYRRKA